MPRWGRSPGAKVGRQTRRRAAPWVDEGSRFEELGSEEEEEDDDDDVYVCRDTRALYARQVTAENMGGGSVRRRRMVEYDDGDNMAAVDEMDYDLHDNMDSTIAYAVQLAMKDKEERLVDQALDRIRRAQVQGQKNVRLSKRELEAIERKRMESRETPELDPRGSPLKGMSSGNRHLRSPASPNKRVSGGISRGNSNVSSPSKHGMPSSLADNNSAYAFWARTSGVSLVPEASPKSPSARPQPNHTPPRSPLQPAYSSERSPSVPLVRNPESMRGPAFTRPLSDDPQWVSTYQPPYPMDPPPHPLDHWRGSVGRVGTTSMLDYRTVLNGSPNSAHNATASQGRLGKATEKYLRNGEGHQSSDLDDNSDELHIVDVVERRVPAGMPTRVPPGRGRRQRGSRP
ncbi:uncharacterized protein BO97DRAFT_358101 [Aspergillus homomorphus CBS 101889]|uniref:Prenylated rab acceptor 1 n=1 Tax=Aspergillus homomorphus (strain CBS 101889) TaxID=1450537 RepID=A0A395HFS0_ASPHC|nr:hypothetical protein BO97DRAFT_358101 [Aspergillus homomorphus CBS 101889]RAL06752.1 hypothetical protein BO97DRAFT_358101 [Aspergillus homomorphus CBS 101889]